jgi:hypothetical protein
MIRGLQRLALKIVLRGSYELLVGVASAFVIIDPVTTSGDCDSLGSSPWPPLVALGASFCSLVDGYGQSSLSAARGCLPAVLHEDHPNCLHARDVPGGDVEDLLSGLWLFTVELMH